MDILLTYTIFILILGALVFIHEFGHFFMAKRAGVVVEQFAFGFGPKLFSKYYKGTDYRINAIPLGGYVKMLGDQDGSSFLKKTEKEIKDIEFTKKYLKEKKIDIVNGNYYEILEKLDALKTKSSAAESKLIEEFVNSQIIPKNKGNFDNISKKKKLGILVGGVFMNLVLAVLIFNILLPLKNWKYITFALPDQGKIPTIGADNRDKFPYLSSIYDSNLEKYQESIIIEINGEPIEEMDFEKFLAENYDKEISLKLLMIKTGKTESASIVLNGEGIKTNLDSDIRGKLTISSVGKDTIAEKAGLKPQTIITAVNGQEIDGFKNFIEIRDSLKNSTIILSILDPYLLSLYGVEVTLPDEDQPKIGVTLFENSAKLEKSYITLLDYSDNKIFAGLSHTVNAISLNFSGFKYLIEESFRQKSIKPLGESVGSIVAVADYTYSFVQVDGFIEILDMAGVLSVVLAIMNILPIPLLDGGHVFFLFLEKFRGRPLSQKKQEIIGQISFLILICFSTVVMFKDIWMSDLPPFSWVRMVFNMFYRVIE